MKIGILTFWESEDNYGQLLQCYALQAYLRKQGHEPFLIRYTPKIERELSASKFSPKHMISYIKYRIGQRTQNAESGIKRDFKTFRNNISYSGKIYHGFQELVAENWDDFDAFICGSDQIWSPKSEDELKAYFLRFTPFQKGRIAYAPSFGRQKLNEEYSKKLSHLISNFDAISVREDTGVKFIMDAGGEATLVCDPTLLLKGSDYITDLNISKQSSNNLFCYFINWETDWDEAALLRLCNEEGLQPTLFTTHGFETSISLNSVQSPEEWLAKLAGAKYSVVNSFHGLVFSILFHIPFAVYLLSGKQAQMNSRITSLLSKLGLSDRIYGNSNPVDKILSRDIDWPAVDEKLKEFREQSVMFLNDALQYKSPVSKRHNICFLTYGGVHHRYGGLDRVTEILADRFEADGHNVSYLSFIDRGEYDKSRQEFFPVSTDRFAQENIIFLDNYIKKHNIDIIINQEGNVNNCIPILSRDRVNVITCLHFNPNYIDDRHLYNKFNKVNPIVKTIAYLGLSLPKVNSYGLSKLRSRLSENYKKNLEWCDKFILLSSYFRHVLVNLVGNDKNLERIESIFNPNSLASYDLEDGETKEKVILYVGRLDNNFKRVDQLIKIIGPLLEKNPEWKFQLCGEGPDKTMLKKLAATLSNKIELVGHVDPEEYYKKGNIIVLASSKSEGWGMVLVEAMNYGVVPVVAGTYESLPDIIENGKDGFITKPDDKDFEVKLELLMTNDSLRKEMGKSATKKTREFAVDQIVKEWYKLFER